jgi:GNAT superfamily N-acetyltransferase
MLTGFHHAQFGPLAALWNSCLPERYRITAELLRANTIDSPAFDWGASAVEIDDDAKPLGFIAIKRSAAHLYAGPDPDQAHVSALVCPSPSMGVDLLAFAKQNLRNRGISRLVFGQDSRHFFPGCPSDMLALRDLLIIEGFEEGGEIYDVQQDLQEYSPDAQVLKPLENGVNVRPPTKDEIPKLESFMHTHFPGRWTYDVLSKAKVEEGPEAVSCLWLDGDVQGFALTQTFNSKAPIAGGVFNQELGGQWGAIGPIGVAKESRGKGLGDALLAATALRLKEQGVRQCVIDWTNLKDWYGKHGFKVSRTYTSFALKLEEAV